MNDGKPHFEVIKEPVPSAFVSNESINLELSFIESYVRRFTLYVGQPMGLLLILTYPVTIKSWQDN